MNSFIAWIGGKKLLRKNILAMFPSKDEYDRYIEVFGGAGWVLFGRETVAKHLEVFNDIDNYYVLVLLCQYLSKALLFQKLVQYIFGKDIWLQHRVRHGVLLIVKDDSIKYSKRF